MAELALGRSLNLPQLRIRVSEWAFAHREILAVVALMSVAALLRFWALDVKALHHDESLHAQFTWYLYEGRGYQHDPLMHGPFKFHAGALIFFLFGDTDFTARLLPALFGTMLVGMPYLLRKQIGMKAVLIAGVLLTISPTILYVSRFFRDDIYITVWTLAIVTCIWRYLDEQRHVYLYAMAVVLALSFATMEITFIHVAILLVFLDLMLAIELGRRRAGEVLSDLAVGVRTLLLVPLAWLVAAAWTLLGRRPFGRDKLPPVGDVLVVLGTLALPQFAAAVQQLPFVGDRGYRVEAEDTLRVTTILVLLIGSAYVGLLWRPKAWLIAAACFFVPFVLLFTTFLTNQPAPWTDAFWQGRGGFFSGIWDSLDYWLDQQDVQRGNQPGYYYALLTPLYEFLPLILSFGGAVWLALRGDSLRRWLLFWLVGIFAGLSIAGEKMPWLEVHIALPLTLVGSLALARALDVLEFEGRRGLTAAILALATAGTVFLLVEGAGLDRLAGGLLGAGVLTIVTAAAISAGLKSGMRAGLTIVVAALLTLTVRTSITASFTNDDTPVEMLVYTQTSPEIRQLRDRIDALAAKSRLGYNLPIVVDSTDGYAWPWAWYLRDYKQVSFIDGTTSGYRPPEDSVMLINRSNVANIDATGYSQVPYKHRWWFNETYRGLTPTKALSTLTNLSELEPLGKFFLYRRPAETTTGSTDAVAFFPESLAAFDANRTPAKPPAEPTLLSDGRVIIGGTGSAKGELLQPTDLSVDRVGNIWVADSRNNRVQKFDAEGRFLTSIGKSGASPGVLNEPWGVAVDDDGFLYVADTWNHRVQRFSAMGELICTWGQPAAKPNPSPLDLFGPRDIVVAPDGTLWLTDTGNKRLVHFRSDCTTLGVFGREGAALAEFSEPVGLAIDAVGNFYVADAWNGRIQRFGPDFSSPMAIPTGWTSIEILAKPYVTILGDGRILTSDPANGVLLLFSEGGARLGSWRPEADSLPLGVAALPDGGFVFSDARRNQLQIVPAGLLDDLFH